MPLLTFPEAKEFYQTLITMDACCELHLSREFMIPKDVIKFSAARTNVVFTNSYVDDNSSWISE
jgi:hypothetical protein